MIFKFYKVTFNKLTPLTYMSIPASKAFLKISKVNKLNNNLFGSF